MKAELIPVLGEKDAGYYLNKNLSSARRILDECNEKGIGIVCYHDETYPAPLREIDDPPLALFYYGDFPKQNKPTIGIVGTRKCSLQAAGAATTFSCSLALSGFQIVSGMADGIDTFAHKGSLVRGNASFAVLGCGIDVIYPKKNADLYYYLKEHGGLLTEYLPGTPPIGANFPRRNRIISGLSDGILVVECPPKSGSMITARYAVEQNRALFAIPAAPNDRVNSGTNQLIKHGAVFCTEPDDILNEFLPRYGDRIKSASALFEAIKVDSGPEPHESAKGSQSPRGKREKALISPKEESTPERELPPTLSKEETAVYQAFDSNEQILSADQICQKTGLAFHRLLPILQALELSGYLDPLPGSMFRRK